MIVRTDGLVLRTHKMTESSLVVVVYTKAWGKVKLEVWTHKISGLVEADFIFSAKADACLSG